MKRPNVERKWLAIAGVLAASLVRPLALEARGQGAPGSAAGVTGDCGQLADHAERATCLAVQLREADRANERIFEKLRGSLQESERTTLLETQSSWAAKRNQDCGLEDEGADHERWLQKILLDPGKTACVLKATNERLLNLSAVEEIQAFAQRLQSRPYAAAPAMRETRHQGAEQGALDCGQAASDSGRSACFGSLLRDTDLTLGRLYNYVARLSNRADGKRLREEQRAWLAARTRTCGLDDTETNRERWFQSVLADTRKTACVLQMTRERIVALAHELPDR